MINYTNIMRSDADYLSPSEINLLIKYWIDHKNFRNALLITTLFRSGRRVSEVVGTKPFIKNPGLRPCDILEDNKIRWRILKKNHIKLKKPNGKLRSETELDNLKEKHLPKEVIKALDNVTYHALKKYVKENNIQPYNRIFPITRKWVDKVIKKAAEKSNLFKLDSAGNKKQIHAHSLRHSLSIFLLKKNNNSSEILFQLQQLLEHSSVTITSHYLQFTDTDLKDTLNKSFGNK